MKGLEDEAEELEELSKLALSPVGVYSMQVSPNPADCPDDTTERAEEALVLIPTEPAEPPPQSAEPPPHAAGEESTAAAATGRPVATASEPATPAKGNGRRTSHSWRGLKKQLSRVDLKLKNTFNATPAKKTQSAAASCGEQQPAEADDGGGGGGCGTAVPQIITEADGQEQRAADAAANEHRSTASSSASAARPTELKLFDREGKPIKPPRSTKEQRKRTSLDKQSGGGNLTAAGTAGSSSRDARLLSVPNIKYSQRDPRHNRSNNQAFINLIKKLSKFYVKKQTPPNFPLCFSRVRTTEPTGFFLPM